VVASGGSHGPRSSADKHQLSTVSEAYDFPSTKKTKLVHTAPSLFHLDSVWSISDQESDNSKIVHSVSSNKNLPQLLQSKTTTIAALPNELLQKVFAYLEPGADLFTIPLVCKHWNQAADDYLFKTVFHLRYRSDLASFTQQVSSWKEYVLDCTRQIASLSSAEKKLLWCASRGFDRFIPSLFQPSTLPHPSLSAASSALSCTVADHTPSTLRRASINVESTGENGETALHFSCKYGHFKVAEFLLSEKANKEASEESFGGTPLFLAIRNQHFDIVRLLVSEGADILAKDWSSTTALETAVISLHDKALLKSMLFLALYLQRPSCWNVHHERKFRRELLYSSNPIDVMIHKSISDDVWIEEASSFQEKLISNSLLHYTVRNNNLEGNHPTSL